MTPTKEKEKSLSTLIKELDIVFGNFIKLRDTKDGVIRCFVCHKPIPRNEAEVLHFIGRQSMPVRFHEQNCNTGCYECNRLDTDHMVKYLIRMNEVYGEDTVLYLTRQSKSLQKWMPFEIKAMIEEYKNKIAILQGKTLAIK